MQRVDVHIQNIAVFINDPHRLLQLAVRFQLLQTTVNTYAMINMGNVIAGLQFAQGTQGNGLVLVIGLLYLVFMITLKYLVIGIADHFQIFINKAFVYGGRYRCKLDAGLQIFKNAVQPL